MSNIKLNIDPSSIPGFTLWQVSKLWQRHLTNAVKPFGIGSTEFVLLGNVVRITQLGKQATQILLTEATKVDRMTASQILRSLEKKGLIRRVGASEDKRTFHVTPTKKGVKIADDALGEVIRAHATFFAPLDNNMPDFLQSMNKLIERGKDEKVT